MTRLHAESGNSGPRHDVTDLHGSNQLDFSSEADMVMEASGIRSLHTCGPPRMFANFAVT